MEKSFPLNDTEYLADDLQMWFAGRTHGVLSLENNLSVTASEGMKVRMSAGHAFLKTGSPNKGGIMYYNENSKDFVVDVADSILDRIDSVVIRYDKVQNTISAYLKKGIPGSTPAAYVPIRDAEAFELVVAEINVQHGIGAITASLIKDTRMDETKCGLIRDNIERIDTQMMYDQFTSFMDVNREQFDVWLEECKEAWDIDKADFDNTIEKSKIDINKQLNENQKTFDQWLQSIQGLLDADSLGHLLSLITQNTPVGEMKQYAGDIAPAGFLLCQGQEVSRVDYADLFSVIGEKFGSGDGSTTFSLPDMQNRVPVGASDTLELGQAGGENEHRLTIDEMPSHTHEQNAHVHGASGVATSAGAHTHTASTVSTGDHTHTVSGSATSAGAHVHKMGRALGGNSGYNYFPVSSENVTGATSDSVYSAGAHTHTVSGAAESAGAHSHTVTVNSYGAHSHTIVVNVDETTAVNQSTGVESAHNNMQKYLVLNYIIKY